MTKVHLSLATFAFYILFFKLLLQSSQLQAIGHLLQLSSRIFKSFLSFCLLPSCLKIFGLCLIIHYQSLQTSAFRLKSSVMLTTAFTQKKIELNYLNQNQSYRVSENLAFFCLHFLENF